MTSKREGRDERDRVPFVGSALIHLAVLALLLWASAVETPPLEFQTFQIEIVSAPSSEPEPEPEPTPSEPELVVDQPDPPEPEEPAPVVDEEPAPEEVQDDPPEPEPEPTPPEEVEEQPAAESEGTETVTPEQIQVRMEGLERLYPQYYKNIINQIGRCFRWQGPPLETLLYFVIRPDGTASGVRVQEGSGNIRFDLAAVEAVADCAGQGRFGPLPENLPYDLLPVLFTIHPGGEPGPPEPREGP